MAVWSAPLLAQYSALLRQFLAGEASAWIAIDSLDRMTALSRTPGMAEIAGRLEVLSSRIPPTRAFVRVQQNEPELWIDPELDRKTCRSYYAAFAKAWLDLPGRPSGEDFNIDHLFPQAPALKDGMAYVRLMAVEAEPNQIAGATLEQEMTNRAERVASGKVIRHATWMTLGKAAGFVGWEALPESDPAANDTVVTRLFAHLAARGINPPAGGIEQRLTAYTLSRIR
jgi:hypothetical protein